ncbi:uncharacterized protein LOC129770748 [Toxorhynchites rutilus septentrionalis]|uniref:uncharacterized protein LOC129770748 n=1 Tax=Toxorhynchites rutilus septentrionalis TaxID=329112 RepID=UPI00247AA459|nr:uncharacterized protein LOC129770748 [Toxorhynchites rutilus septentrionalis]XP_055629760.1 uncharacterized protein LOC129770748 [Toxorhynchites rutilus septentrionalis]XP_055629761.1 uncharacterized protein LOC129770748 [Toxorhynchites rutilus septentrionalis]
MVITMNILDLPEEIQLQILDFLDFGNRLAASKVCRLWNELAFCGQFMNRICLHLNISEGSLDRTMDNLESNGRPYRRIVINFNNTVFPTIDRIALILGAIDSIASLVLTGIKYIEPCQLLSLLSNTPNLNQLCLSDDDDNFPESYVSNTPWYECFSYSPPIFLPIVQRLQLVFPKIYKPTLESLPNIFPNLEQLELTTNSSSIITVCHAYRNQLERLSILSPQRDFFILFCEMEFRKISQLHFDQFELHDQLIVEKCTRFFLNPNHRTNLEQLIFHPRFMIRTAIFTTICRNCSVLQELELSLDYMNGDALKEIINLKMLQNLSLYGTAYFHETPRCLQTISCLKRVKISASRFPISLLEFIADIAPKLETLALEDIQEPEAIFQIMPGIVGSLQHLEMSFSDSFETPSSCRPSGFLKSMASLQTYRLRRVIIGHGIQGWLQDAPNLRSVSLDNCRTLNDTHLVILTTNCPKLRQLTLKRCGQVTATGVAQFSSRVPLCSISCELN